MAINYEKWQNRWSSNEVIVLVLVSLGMQICLIFLAPLRKRSKNTVLKLTLWLLYLTADSVAILALGNISNQDDPAESGDSGTVPGKITVLWAPFLLLHLGGPDSITSYSVEDNELWWRHLLGLFVQVVVTVYVFWQSPPKGLMWIPTMLVFIPGLIKFAERTHALRLGSKDNLKDKIISEISPVNDTDKVLQSDNNDNTTSNTDDTANGTTKDSNDNPTSNPADPANGTTKDSNDNTTSNPVDQPNGTTKVKPSNREKESEDICDGYKWFDMFKRLLVDVTFSSNLLMQSQDHFSGMEAKDALNLVAIELSFMYDILHTKAGHMHNNSGRVLRCFSLVSIIAALVVFHHLDMQKYASKDIIITYILFGAGLILEVIAAVFLISSDWTVVSLRKKGWRKCIARAITSMVKGITFQKGKTRWSRNIGQFNLVGLCLRDRYTPHIWIMKKLNKLKHIWDNMRESSTIGLPELFEDIMFTEAKRRAQNVHIYNVLLEARSYRGGKALERHNQKNLEWSLKRDFDESIILWHVATDICYYNETRDQPKEKDDTKRGVSWKTSNYMVYLLTQQQSMMQLGYGMTRFEATCAAIKKKFKGKEKLEDKKARKELMKDEVPGQNDAQESADSRQPTNKITLVLKKIWENLRCWGRSKAKVEVSGQNDAHVSADSRQSTNKITLVLKKIWENLRCWGRSKAKVEVSGQNDAHVSADSRQSTNKITLVLKKIWENLRCWGRSKAKVEVSGQNDAHVSADSRQSTNKITLVLKKIWENLRCWGRSKAKVEVSGQNDAHVSADSRQPTNKKKMWENLRFWGRSKANKEEKLKVEADMGEAVLKDCLRLAKELEALEPEIKWKLISETWMEMLGYAAIHCDSYQHAKSLRRGGELLTHLWLLMSQLGVVEEHKMQQYQSGTV